MITAELSTPVLQLIVSVLWRGTTSEFQIANLYRNA